VLCVSSAGSRTASVRPTPVSLAKRSDFLSFDWKLYTHPSLMSRVRFLLFNAQVLIWPFGV